MRFTGFIIILLYISLWGIPHTVGAQPDFFVDQGRFNAPQIPTLQQNSNGLEFVSGLAFSNFNTNQYLPRVAEPETEFNYVIRDDSRPDTMPISLMNFKSALGFVAPTYYEADTPRLSQSGLWFAEHQGYGVTIQFIPGTTYQTAEEIIQNAVLGIPSVTMNVQDAPLIIKVRVGSRGEADWVMEMLKSQSEIVQMDAMSEVMGCGWSCG